MPNHALPWYALAALALGCTPTPHPASGASSINVRLVAALEPATDGRPQMIGRPWLRQRAVLSLRGSEASVVLDAEAGVADVRCPEELAGTSMQGCGGPADARALEQRVDRAHEEWRGEAATRGRAVQLTLRPVQGVGRWTLSCRQVDAGLDCDEVSGWPVPEGFRSPSAATFARAP